MSKTEKVDTYAIVGSIGHAIVCGDMGVRPNGNGVGEVWNPSENNLWEFGIGVTQKRIDINTNQTEILWSGGEEELFLKRNFYGRMRNDLSGAYKVNDDPHETVYLTKLPQGRYSREK